MMRSYRRTAPGVLEEVALPVPEPGPGEVLLAVAAAGLCHTDLAILDAPAGAFPVPLTLGHEISGRVAATGPGVTGWEPGRPAVVFALESCGTCRACLGGRENHCRVSPIGGNGLTRDGGLADYVLVPAARLIALGPEADLARSAPLPDAGLSPYHAIRAVESALGPGSVAVVIGTGGLGHLAVQILRATTAAEVIAVDTHDDALELARRVGAHHTVRSGPDTAATVRRIAGPAPGGADAVIDCVGATATLELSRDVVAKGGHVLMVGLGGGQLLISPAPGSPSFPAEASLRQSFWGSRGELADVVALAATGRLAPAIERFAFKDVPDAYDLLRRGGITGRAVVVL